MDDPKSFEWTPHPSAGNSGSWKPDGVYINIAVGNYHLETLKQPKALVFDPSLPHTRDSYRLSSLKHSALLERFSSFLKSQAKELEIIRKQYKVDIN